MKLNFTKDGGHYVCEFEATSDFNIHIERSVTGIIMIYQKTISDGEYDYATSLLMNGKVIDVDIVALVYPKYIKIVSEIEPTLAEVTFAS